MGVSCLVTSGLLKDWTTKVTIEWYLSLSSAKWKTCKSSSGCGAAPAPSAGWARGHSLYQFVFWPHRTRWGNWFSWIWHVEKQDGESIPQTLSRTSQEESHPDQMPKDVLGAKGRMRCWNETLEASPGRFFSCLLAMLKHISGDASARLLTATHFVNSCGSTRHQHPPPQWGISALFSSIATLRFITLDSPVRLAYKRFSSLNQHCLKCAKEHSHVLSCHWQHKVWEPSIPLNQADFRKGVLEQPQQHLHTQKNNTSNTISNWCHTINPATELYKQHIAHYIEINQSRGAAMF